MCTRCVPGVYPKIARKGVSIPPKWTMWSFNQASQKQKSQYFIFLLTPRTESKLKLKTRDMIHTPRRESNPSVALKRTGAPPALPSKSSPCQGPRPVKRSGEITWGGLKERCPKMGDFLLRPFPMLQKVPDISIPETTNPSHTKQHI